MLQKCNICLYYMQHLFFSIYRMVINQILEVFKKNEIVKSAYLVKKLDVDRSTIYRNLKKLLEEDKIKKIKK